MPPGTPLQHDTHVQAHPPHHASGVFRRRQYWHYSSWHGEHLGIKAMFSEYEKLARQADKARKLKMEQERLASEKARCRMESEDMERRERVEREAEERRQRARFALRRLDREMGMGVVEGFWRDMGWEGVGGRWTLAEDGD